MQEGVELDTSGKVVATEVAEREFERFCEAMDIDIDPTTMDDDDRKGLENARRRFVRQVEIGKLVLDGKSQPVLTTVDGKTFVFHEPTGASYMAMDGKKKDHNVTKMNAIIADITRKDISEIAKLTNRDYKICQTIITLFLG